MIPYGRQSLDEDDVAAVVAVLRSDWLTQGPCVTQFEEVLAEKVGARFAVAFSSGTAALHAAVAASGLGPGAEVVTSSLSFVASANCARYVRAVPTFIDIDPATLNMDLMRLPSTAEGMVAVHYAGLPLDFSKAPHRPRVIIEDAAHALGATTPDGPVGNCAHSDMCAFSFHPVKAITTGEGGAVTTNDPGFAESLRKFRTHGVTRATADSWLYEIEEMGFNYRMTDMQAALGTSQLKKLDTFVNRRQELADRYRRELRGVDVILPPLPPTGFSHAYHLFPVRVRNRRRVYYSMREAGIATQVHYIPIHQQPFYSNSATPTNLPATDLAYSELLSLPIYPGLDEEDQDYVISTLATVLSV